MILIEIGYDLVIYLKNVPDNENFPNFFGVLAAIIHNVSARVFQQELSF